MKTKIIPIVIISVFWAITLCAQNKTPVLTKQEERQGWKLLFNGKDLNGWTSVGKSTAPSFGWQVVDGVLSLQTNSDKRGGDIISVEKYTNFDLSIEFRLAKDGNSGIKYFFTKYEKGGWLGLEYQILDDVNHPDAKNGRSGNRLQGTLYDMFPLDKKQENRIGEWNHARIVAKGSKVTHYLNGKRILSFDRNDKNYQEAWKLSKYKDSEPVFGHVKSGHILLQDHGDEVSFRNIKIKEL